MDPVKELEETLREATCNGDEDSVINLLQNGNINVNTQHTINGWSALHWAAKRGHVRIAALLLKSGADKNLQTAKGEIPINLTSNPTLRVLLGGEPNGELSSDKEDLPITPHYLANPPFPYIPQSMQKPMRMESPVNLSVGQDPRQHIASPALCNSVFHVDEEELVLKVRVANAAETDFIEIELDKRKPTFEALQGLMCKELNVKRELVQKVRKLPNTIVRKDKDVKRLKDFQELELVLSNKAICESSRSYGPAVSSPKHIDVVY